MNRNYLSKLVELIDAEKGKILATVCAIDENSITVKDWDFNSPKIFVYGKQVNDLRLVDYQQLSMLNLSAIQQISKNNQALKQKLEKYEIELAELEKNSHKNSLTNIIKYN